MPMGMQSAMGLRCVSYRYQFRLRFAGRIYSNSNRIITGGDEID
jgi:hypothetical protein